MGMAMAMERENKFTGTVWDLHSHILPGIDDGCKTVEESLQMLRVMQEQRVAGVAATPHYYPEESVKEFVERRRVSFERLNEAIKDEAHPAICLGAEVAYHPGLVYEDDIRKLCLGKSNFLLLEMPFSRWTPSVLRSVSALRHIQGVIPILAHLERYLGFQEKRVLEEVLHSGALIQMNASYVLDNRRKAMKLIRKGMVDVFGSDCHNMTKRPPDLSAAIAVLCDGPCEAYARRINETAGEIFEDAM